MDIDSLFMEYFVKYHKLQGYLEMASKTPIEAYDDYEYYHSCANKLDREVHGIRKSLWMSMKTKEDFNKKLEETKVIFKTPF